MAAYRKLFSTTAIILGCLLHGISSASAQGTMPGMAAMENSVGFLSAGTSIEPKTTSESVPMIHKPLGSWTLMFHGNALLADVQQKGPRGAEQLFTAMW